MPVTKRFGLNWYEDHRFENILPLRTKETLKETVRKEKAKRKAAFTVNHVIAALPFGFWANMMTRSFDKHLWANGVRVAFPLAGPNDTREVIYERLEKIRNIRNDVMHHYAVFDKGPQAEIQNALHLVGLICSETEWFAHQLGTMPRVINDRPKP